MQCNIDAKGKAARLIWGIVMLLAGIVVGALVLTDVLGSAWWWGAGALLGFGGLGIFEARAGWCVVRAMGFKTPM